MKRTADKTMKTDAKILVQAVLAQVPFDGWTEEAFVHGAKTAGVALDAARAECPKGIADVIDRFGAMTDDAMQARIDAEPGFARFRVRDKVIFAIRARLEWQAPYREAVRRLMTWYAMPTHLRRGLARMTKTVDLVWRAAGDTSTDYNYYTKRILLAAVLKATVLFWLDDETPGCRASWDFLDRRIADVMKLGKSLSLLKEFSPSEIGGFIRRKMGRT